MRRAGTFLLILILSLPAVGWGEDGGPSSLALELKTINSLRARGDYQEALRRVTQLLADNPDSLAANVAYEDLRLARGESKELIEIYAARSERADATADDHFLYARLLDGRRANLILKKALRSDPNHFWSLCALGANSVSEGDYRSAAKYLDRAREVDPRSPVPVNSAAWLAESTGETEQAEKLYRRALELDPSYNLSRVNLGILLIGTRRYEEAGVVLEEARRRAPADPMPLLGLGMARAAAGDLDAAIGFFKRSVALDTNTVASWNLLGTTYMGLSQYELAEESFAKALRAQPDNVTTLLNLGYLALRQGNLSEARSWVARALKSDPKSPEAYYFLGLCFERNSEAKDAERAYRKAADLDRSNPNYLKALAVFYGSQGRWREAVAAYDRAADLSGRSVESLMDLGFGYLGAGQPKKAIACFEEVVEKDPDNLKAWMNIGLVSQEQLKDRDRAIHAYQEYLQRGGTDSRVQEWLESLK